MSTSMIGSIINLKDGRKAVITNVGLGDFLGDAYPVYYTTIGSPPIESGFLMSNELKPTGVKVVKL